MTLNLTPPSADRRMRMENKIAIAWVDTEIEKHLGLFGDLDRFAEDWQGKEPHWTVKYYEILKTIKTALQDSEKLRKENHHLVWKLREQKKDENVIGELQISNNLLRVRIAEQDILISELVKTKKNEIIQELVERVAELEAMRGHNEDCSCNICAPFPSLPKSELGETA